MIISAPAKVILHGEHAVVYGKVALAASLGLRTTLKWERLNEDRVELHLDDLGFSSSWTITQLENLPSFPKGTGDFTRTEATASHYVPLFKTFLNESETDISETAFTAALAFIYLYKAIYGKTGSLIQGKFVVKSDVPVGAGLGSSASYSVVVATSLLVTACAICPETILKMTTQSSQSKSSAKTDSLKLINKWAYEGEKIMHGNPSGIDNTMSTFGGFLQFQSGKIENLDRVPELKILLVNTNVPRSTKAMVSGLKKRYEEMPCVYEPIFSAMGAMAIKCVQVLGKLGDQSQTSSFETDERMHSFQILEKLIDLNQELLRAVDVSHPTVDKVCEKTKEYACHSKLTGAGGGGCVVTLIKEGVTLDAINKLCEELKTLGCNFWNTKLGGSGVLLHEWS